MFSNKKGQQIIVNIMIAVVALIAVIAMSQPINDSVIDATNTTNLNCTNLEISTQDDVTCNVVEFGFFYIYAIGIAISLALITGRKTITGVMTAIFVFILTILLITPLKDLIIIARDSTHLNCGAAGISIGANMACIVIDLWLFYFVATAIATAVTLVVLKKGVK